MTTFMEYTISTIWILIELECFFIFSDAFLNRKRKTACCQLVLLLTCLVMVLYSNTRINAFFKQGVTMCIAGLLSFYLFHGSWQRHILTVVLSYIFIGVSDILVIYGTSFCLGISYMDLVWKKMLYTMVVTIARLLNLLIAYILRRIRNNKPHPVRGKWLLLILLFPAVSLIMLALVFNGYQHEQDLSPIAFAGSCIVAIANIAVIYLIHMLELSTKKEQAVFLLNQQITLQSQSILTLERSYREQRKATHDYKNHLQTIYDLLVNKKEQAAKEYVQQLQGIQVFRVFDANTNHPFIDAILNQKYHVAKKAAIDIQLQVNDLSAVWIEANVLVVLLANLLDNAIEACQRLPSGRAIHCCILLNDSLYVSIRNTSQPVTILDGNIETTKTPKEDHGYGLISIKHILHNLNAEFVFNYEDGWFSFAAEIPNVGSKTPDHTSDKAATI